MKLENKDLVERLYEELKYLRRFVDYVSNCKGNVTRGDFVQDLEPIGEQVLDRCIKLGLLEIDGECNVILTPQPLECVEKAVKVEKV